MSARLQSDAVQAWLLEKDDPGARYLALRDIYFPQSTKKEIESARTAAHLSGPISILLKKMKPEGYWAKPGPGYSPKYFSTVWSLIQLAQLGGSIHADRRIATACQYLVAHAWNEGGQFSHSSVPSGTIDCLQGNLCWALTELGFESERLEKAFEWMARSVTGEGVASAQDTKATVRYYAYKCGPNFACGPNNKLPCAWGAVKVMLAFGALPASARTPLIQRAITAGKQFFFSVDPVSAAYPMPAGKKPNSGWWKFGFPIFYITDLVQLVEACTQLGFGDDTRLKNAKQYIREQQNPEGKWLLHYRYTDKTRMEYGEKRAPNKWVTIRALRALR
jgi:hypothetical protein